MCLLAEAVPAFLGFTTGSTPASGELLLFMQEDWEATDEQTDRGDSYHIVRRWIWPNRDIFVPTRFSHLRLAGNLYLPNTVWGLSLR